MPKMKSNRSARKSFKVTATGKIKRRKAFRRHILTSKSSKRKRHLRRPTLVSKADEHRIHRLMLA
ncbi:MAG TPA: 50S ribosomal protein L35 [Bacteroidota bacterium]|nr:50S ribosomal protein L35 [Bacteroidota bacterium]